MQESLFAQGLRVSGLLLEAVTAPEQLRVALELLTAMAGADAGLLACARRGDRKVDSVTVTADGANWARGSADEMFPAFSAYRRWSQGQPGGRLYFAADLDRLAGNDGGAAPDGTQRAGTSCCMGHVDVGENRVCYLGFARRDPGDGTGFDPVRAHAIEELMPHLRQAVTIARRLESMHAISAAMMSRFDGYHVGVVLVDAEGAPQYCNLAARRLLEAGHGLCLDPLGRLAAREPADDAALRGSLSEHMGSGSSEVRAPPALLRIGRPGAAAPLVVAITPYDGGPASVLYGGAHRSAVLMIHDPDSPPITRSELVGRVLELNEQESQLVCAIAEGASLEDFARRSGRSHEAVRSQLKRVFRKTGTSRQSELVRIVLSGPAAIAL